MKFENIKPERVFYYFGNICDVPHGSGDTDGIGRYCKNFARNHGLKYEIDDSNNVVIYKPGTAGYEDSEPVILQGHTDMVCQKADGYNINFVERGIEAYVDGDFVKARGTTLGADNGIAVAMILAILEDDTIAHPPIEAVFTTDEEIGMIGAKALDKTLLKGKRMVNQYGFFTHYDDDYNVKYLIVSPYYMNEDGTRGGVEIRTDQMKWLLSELAADDGYDVVLLMHQLWTDTYISRNGTLQSWADAPVVLENMWSVLKDRKNNRSGTITDSSGVEHSYNFSNCKTELLVSLHGHSHEELYLQEENMLAYAADWYGNGNTNRCTFGLIDRINSKVTFWVFDSTGCWEPLELAI